MWHSYHAPGSIDEALALLAHYGDACRVIAGGTDLILELERGRRAPGVLVDISRIAALDTAHIGLDTLTLGALASHNRVVASPDAVARAFPLARACWLVGAPQIRNRGTVAGNLVTASPANDTIAPLRAMDATVTLASQARGERTLAFDAFFQGVRRTALQPDELLVRINVPALLPTERGTFLKLGLRQAQAISIVNAGVVVDFAGSTVRRARIALGAVAPTILRAAEAEAYLTGRELHAETINRAAELAAGAARPISDIRGSAEYRRGMVRVLVSRGLQQLAEGTERAGWPEQPLLLRTAPPRRPLLPPDNLQPGRAGRVNSHARTTFNLNGRPVTLPHAHGKTLLRALREDAGLTGTKEGCAEGECGACTVWLDGVAVMSCLVPAERAVGCEVVTVEGLAPDGALHPVQQAFVDAGAVQCGYCTPGLIMSAAMLLAEIDHPTPGQIKEALTGNLCRCTGYYKILEAVDRAAATQS
jgi:xanthine dehydrogenase iron-sulfur cluster and FAD-binding subunit A